MLRVFESLSSGVRLDAFHLLVEAGAKGLVAGDIARSLDISPTNLSFHLKELANAGLVSVQPEGRFHRYRADVAQVLRLLACVTECCLGQRIDAPASPNRIAGPLVNTERSIP